MASYTVNRRAVRHCRDLIAAGKCTAEDVSGALFGLPDFADAWDEWCSGEAN